LSGDTKFFWQSYLSSRYKEFPKFLLLTLSLFLAPLFNHGQTIKEFREIWVNESREYLRNNQKPLPYLQSGFHYFSRKQDDAFTEILEGNWENFPVAQGTPVPKSRKYDPAPQFVFEEASYHNPQSLPCITNEMDEVEFSEFSANLPRIRKPEYITLNPLKLNYKFYGNSIAVACDRLLALPVNKPANRETIVEFWKMFLAGNNQHLIDQLMTIRKRLGLNEWGYFLLAKSVSEALYPNDETGAVFLTWGLMLHSGYDVRIGYNQLGVSILYRTSNKIFGVPYVKIGGSEYYIDRPISSFPITSLASSHPGSPGAIHLPIRQALNFQGEIETKKIAFFWDKKQYEFTLKYNPEVTRFLEEYPQTDPGIIFGTPFTQLSLESLQKQLNPVLAGMKREAGAAFLQQFVQKSFTYRPYNDLYGYDRFMFPEELLFKDESNDKGKALLYAWMISNLLNQKAALVEFPGFYSVAISMDQPMDGDNFLLNGRMFTIADPTFDNAPLGLVMKEYYPLKPFVRILKKHSETLEEEAKIWKLALAFGARRSGSETDCLQDGKGNFYITGYISEKTANHSIPSPAPFLAKFNEKKVLEWMIKLRSDCHAFGLDLKQLDDDEFYLAGSFRGKLECNGKMVQTAPTDPDLFFVQFNRFGEIKWMTRSGLDEIEEETKLFYIVRFTRSGDIQSVHLSNEDEREGTTGFQKNTNEGLCYVASRYQSSGLDKNGEESSPKPTLLFRQNLNRMKQLGTDPNIASLAAVFKSLVIAGNQLSGSDLYAFRREKAIPEINSGTYMTKLLQQLRLIKNNFGIIELITADAAPLNISPYIISNRSHFKIIPLDNNDLKINVIDGVFVETGTRRERINSFIIEHSTGNLIFDIGNEHQIITRNLKFQIPK